MKTEYISLNTCVVGTGAAGYNAAVRLKEYGCESVAIVTEDVKAGTSRNTGSDKQTYYKLGLCGETPDSVVDMAKDLFDGGCVDGDNALIEAALSVRCFMRLCELGVPFPVDRFGQYVGYKTDHDPHERATSAGPLTSKMMTERLEKRANELGVPVYDRHTVVKILKNGENEASGLLCLKETPDGYAFTVFNCKNVVFATGGPAGMYENSVYPACHHGSSGVLFEAGAKGQNLTEWQYGLASTSPRWNVSGTYMQALPRFVSVDSEGNEREFLSDYFKSDAEMLSMIFLKGYQWPFDCKKVKDGSSVIDLLVFREEVLLGRKVYLDFTKNPCKMSEINYESLCPEAKNYLRKAHACFGTPIERLSFMNAPAVELYREKGVDLGRDLLQISLSAQHNNGGIAVDLWWQTSVKGLFAAGEAAGTHGISRPGGSALNAGQVGSLRAAEYIAAKRAGEPEDQESLEKRVSNEISKEIGFIKNALTNGDNVNEKIENARRRMSRAGAAIRRPDEIEKALSEAKNDLDGIGSVGGDPLLVYRFKDLLISQITYLSAMADYCRKGFGSRGSFIVCNGEGELREGLDETFRFALASGGTGKNVQEAEYENGGCKISYRLVRPIPNADLFFENVWKTYRENGNIE